MIEWVIVSCFLLFISEIGLVFVVFLCVFVVVVVVWLGVFVFFFGGGGIS